MCGRELPDNAGDARYCETCRPKADALAAGPTVIAPSPAVIETGGIVLPGAEPGAPAATTVPCPLCRREVEVGDDATARVECPDCETSFIPDRVRAATPTGLSPARLEGRTLGDYTIHERLGEGGFGIVYRATHTVLGREAAVKVLFDHIARDPDNKERFLREARLASALEHPGIVSVLGAGESGSVPYIAMERVDGTNLAEVVHEGGHLEAERAARIVLSACSALGAAHEAGIMHRDIKPANILLCADDTVKVTDFGLARKLEASTIITQGDILAGTPTYMAPELLDGVDPSPRTDIYALGATLFYLLTGREVHEDDDNFAMIFRRRWEEVRPARDVESSVPQALSDITAKMLAKSATRRYASCGEVAADLETFLAGEAVEVDVPKGDVPVEELPFGVVALKQRLVSEEQLLKCIRLQEAARGRGERVPPLGELMVREGLVSPERIPRMLTPVPRRDRGARRGAMVAVGTNAPRIKLGIAHDEDRTIVRPTGAGDDRDLEKALDPVIAGLIKRSADEVVIDLSQYRTVTADFGGYLIGVNDQFKQSGKTLEVVVDGHGKKVFTLIGLDRILTITHGMAVDEERLAFIRGDEKSVEAHLARREANGVPTLGRLTRPAAARGAREAPASPVFRTVAVLAVTGLLMVVAFTTFPAASGYLVAHLFLVGIIATVVVLVAALWRVLIKVRSPYVHQLVLVLATWIAAVITHETGIATDPGGVFEGASLLEISAELAASVIVSYLLVRTVVFRWHARKEGGDEVEEEVVEAKAEG